MPFFASQTFWILVSSGAQGFPVASTPEKVAEPASTDTTYTTPSEEEVRRCWRTNSLRSAHFLCCGRVNEPFDGLWRPDCWEARVAWGSADACCSQSRITALDSKVLAAHAAEGASPCADAGSQVWGFVENMAKLLSEGRLFPAGSSGMFAGYPSSASVDFDETWFIENADATYEACPAALLLALLSKTAHALALRDSSESEKLVDAFSLWDSIRWTHSLAWENLQDPLMQRTLFAASLQFKVVQGLAWRPATVCHRFIQSVRALLTLAAGSSLTVSTNRSENLHMYGSVAATAVVIAGTAEILVDIEPECLAARQIAHVFTARRLLDLRPKLASWHMKAAKQLEEASLDLVAQGGQWIDTLNKLYEDLEVHMAWLSESLQSHVPFALPSHTVSMGPLSIWERDLAPVFSESYKDPVIERIFSIIRAKHHYFVEIGTQSGEQCNTRYLRVRYGFRGLMIDDNYENAEVNQHRHRVTPQNIGDLFRRYAVPREFDVLSLDTDGYEWLLWQSLRRDSYSPRVVILEFNMAFPYDEDVLVRYTLFPVHRLCLASLQRFQWLAGGSMKAILALGRRWGYHLIHVVAGGTSDLIFVRHDVLAEKNLMFPAQDDPAGLCALASYQADSQSSGGVCQRAWPARNIPQEVLTTSSAALRGDYWVPEGWGHSSLQEAFC